MALLEPKIALLLVRIVLGLYWLDHGARLYIHQRANPTQLDKSMTSLKPTNSLGLAMLNGIKKNYATFSVATPVSMMVAGLFTTLGIITVLAALATVVISIMIMLMEPKGPGSMRILFFLVFIGLIVAASTKLALFAPFSG